MSLVIQETLTKEELLVLDTTCSEKKVWPRFASLRIDIRSKAGPDVQASATNLPFRDALFTEVYCDPPHMIKKKKTSEEPVMSAWFASKNRKLYPHQHFLNCIGRFSSWTSREEWLNFIQQTNAEFYRVLKPNGVLHYKLCELRQNSVKFSDLHLLTDFTLMASRDRLSPLGHNKTRYFTFRRKENA